MLQAPSYLIISDNSVPHILNSHPHIAGPIITDDSVPQTTTHTTGPILPHH